RSSDVHSRHILARDARRTAPPVPLAGLGAAAGPAAAKGAAMRLWEIAGWLLLAVGLLVFYRCYTLLVPSGTVMMVDPSDGREKLVPAPPRIIEAGPLTVIGIFIFRGGIHLLKIAAAARVCRGLSEQLLTPGSTGTARVRSPKTALGRA